MLCKFNSIYRIDRFHGIDIGYMELIELMELIEYIELIDYMDLIISCAR